MNLIFHHLRIKIIKNLKANKINAFNQFNGEIIAIYECSVTYIEVNKEKTLAWIKQIISSKIK